MLSPTRCLHLSILLFSILHAGQAAAQATSIFGADQPASSALAAAVESCATAQEQEARSKAREIPERGWLIKFCGCVTDATLLARIPLGAHESEVCRALATADGPNRTSTTPYQGNAFWNSEQTYQAFQNCLRAPHDGLPELTPVQREQSCSCLGDAIRHARSLKPGSPYALRCEILRGQQNSVTEAAKDEVDCEINVTGTQVAATRHRSHTFLTASDDIAYVQEVTIGPASFQHRCHVQVRRPDQDGESSSLLACTRSSDGDLYASRMLRSARLGETRGALLLERGGVRIMVLAVCRQKNVNGKPELRL